MYLQFLTKAELEDFIAKAMLTETEEKIVRTRAKGWSREQQAQAFDRSLSSIDKIIKKIAKKKEMVEIEQRLDRQ